MGYASCMAYARASLSLLGASFLLVAGDARSQVVGAPSPVGTAAPVAPAATFTTLVVNGAIAVPGDSKTFEALLRRGGQAPIAGKTVALRFTGPDDPSKKPVVVKAGTAVTDAAGVARFATRIPIIGAGRYRVEASFEGEGSLLRSTGSNDVAIIKGLGQIVFSPIEKSFPGRCKTRVALVRTVDGSDHPGTATLTSKVFSSSGSTVSKTETLPFLVVERDNQWQSVGGRTLTATFTGDDTMQPVAGTLEIPGRGCD